MNLKQVLEGFDLPQEWSVYRVLASGREELVASGVTLEQAERISRQVMNQRRPGVTVSMREAFQIDF